LERSDSGGIRSDLESGGGDEDRSQESQTRRVGRDRRKKRREFNAVEVNIFKGEAAREEI